LYNLPVYNIIIKSREKSKPEKRGWRRPFRKNDVPVV